METFAELLGFLSNSNPQVRKIAVQNVSAFTKSPDHIAYLKFHARDSVKQVCRLIGDEKSICQSALGCLINLSAEDMLRFQMLQAGVITRVMDVVASENDGGLLELCMILLSNVTQTEEGARRMMQVDSAKPVNDPTRGYYMSVLLDIFLTNTTDKAENTKFSYARWIANVLTNVTKIEDGREFFYVNAQRYLPRLISFFDAPDPVRRGGVAGTFRNLVLPFEHHSKLVSSDLVQPLLRSVKFEKNKGIRNLFLQSLVLLSDSEEGKALLLQENAADFIVKNLSEETETELKAGLRLVIRRLNGEVIPQQAGSIREGQLVPLEQYYDDDEAEAGATATTSEATNTTAAAASTSTTSTAVVEEEDVLQEQADAFAAMASAGADDDA